MQKFRQWIDNQKIELIPLRYRYTEESRPWRYRYTEDLRSWINRYTEEKSECQSPKQKQSNAEVTERRNEKRVVDGNKKNRQLKYFGHIKKHNTFMKTILEGNMKEVKREVDNGTIGKKTPKDG